MTEREPWLNDVLDAARREEDALPAWARRRKEGEGMRGEAVTERERMSAALYMELRERHARGQDYEGYCKHSTDFRVCLDEIDALKAELREKDKRAESLAAMWVLQIIKIHHLEAEVALLKEQNLVLELSAKHCISCGLLLPNHEDFCGREAAEVARLRGAIQEDCLMKCVGREAYRGKLRHESNCLAWDLDMVPVRGSEKEGGHECP